MPAQTRYPGPNPRWFALGAFFSLFSLFALVSGDERWLGFLGFLGALGFLGVPWASNMPSNATGGKS